MVFDAYVTASGWKLCLLQAPQVAARAPYGCADDGELCFLSSRPGLRHTKLLRVDWEDPSTLQVTNRLMLASGVASGDGLTVGDTFNLPPPLAWCSADPSQNASLRNWTVNNILYAEVDNYGCSLGQELVYGVCAPCRSGRYRAETTKSDLLCQRCPLNSHSPLTTGAQTFGSHGFLCCGLLLH